MHFQDKGSKEWLGTLLLLGWDTQIILSDRLKIILACALRNVNSAAIFIFS